MFASVRRLGIILSIAWLVTGCANLTAIQEFGRTSADTAGFAQHSNIYADSPLTRKQFTLEADTEARAKLDAQHAQRKALTARLMINHGALADYMDALADLAGDEVPSTESEVGGLIDSATRAGLVNTADVAAAKSIGALITSAALDGYRQQKLNTLIGQGNAPVQALVADLLGATQRMQDSLETETVDATRHYRALSDLARQNNREPAAAELVWAARNLSTEMLAQRKQSLPARIEALRLIAAGHQTLFDNRNNIKDKQVQGQIKTYAKKIRAAYHATRAAS